MKNNVRGLEYFMSLMDDESFRYSVKNAREPEIKAARAVRSFRIMEEYHIPSWLVPVVANYIETNKVEENLIDRPLYVVRTKTGVVLQLAPDIKQPDLIKYITKHWTSDIEPALDAYEPNRIKRLTIQPFPRRDRVVYEDYLNKKLNGLSNTGIAEKHGIDVRTVSRIVKKLKKDK